MMTLKDLNIGDTFINSYDNKTSIIDINRTYVYLLSVHGTKWNVSHDYFISMVKTGKYTDYKPMKLNVEDLIPGNYYKCLNGVILQWFNQTQFYILPRANKYCNCDGNFNNKHGFIPASPKEIEHLQLCKNAGYYISTTETTNGKWKVGPLKKEASLKLLKVMNAEGISTTKVNNYFYYDGKDDFGRYTNVLYFKKSKLEKITLTQILKNKDEKNRKIKPEYRREKGGTAITSNSTRKTANASRLVGNSISNRIQETRVGRFEISRTAISI